MARRPRPGALTPEAIQAMTPLEVEQMLAQLGVTVDQQAMFDAADQMFARAGHAIRAGVEDLDPATWQMVDGQVERLYNDLLRKQLKSVVRDVRMDALSTAAAAAGQEPTFIWIATLSGTCESCLDRHGEVKALVEWEADGLPGAPVLLCNGNCNCQLLPYAKEAVEEEVYLDLLGGLDEDLATVTAGGDLSGRHGNVLGVVKADLRAPSGR